MLNMGRFSFSFLGRYLLLWVLFFIICFGLGYPTLSRYDPRIVLGLSDVEVYYETVTGESPTIGRAYMRSRILVPYVARPFYWFASRYLKSWNAVFFGLLVANSIFCATSACLLINIARRLAIDGTVALLAATMYLLNFALPNLQLGGLIDSGESLFMLAIVDALLAGRWYLLPFLGVFGAMAKETFVPFAIVFVATWWITAEWRSRSKQRNKRLAWLTAFGFISVAALITLHSVIGHRMVWPWTIASEANGRVSLLPALIGQFTNHHFWYVFAWLLPLGLWKLRRLPLPWLTASFTTSLTALAFGAWKNMGGTVSRPLFDVVGPMLTLSTALLMAALWKDAPADSRGEDQQAH
jgi:hypothetical protein